MEDNDSCTCSLEEARSTFLRTLLKVDPNDSEDFVEWVMEHCSNAYTSKHSGETIDDTLNWAEKRLKKIAKDIKRIIPLQGVLDTEKIRHPLCLLFTAGPSVSTFNHSACRLILV